METKIAEERQQTHALVDMLPLQKLTAVRSLLEAMILPEPLTTSLAGASEEDEPVTAETSAALERARASLARGEGILHDQILREFGLSK